ncbi:MAG: sulfatase [Thermoanaerobaculales bacterium]|jgi:arylsulfatase|nr:sulfatase [Thermoanaerobaculales bacterium]
MAAPDTQDFQTRRRMLAMLILAVAAALNAAAEPPQAVVIVTIDALRADRLSGYGYHRTTSPAIDEIFAEGVRFESARTVEPLTAPALCSMITGVEPHKHAATRNGLRMHSGIASLPKILTDSGWTTAAVVSNWTLRDELTTLGEHFDHYGEVYTRRRWFGLLNPEATGEDVTDQALEWFEEHAAGSSPEPFLLWVHYVEPHAPYRFHKEFADSLGITDRDPSRSDRYDTEVAAVDHAVDRLLKGIEARVPADEMILIFTADHGESLGEHDYWGHGRHLYEPSLRIPMGIRWKGTIEPHVIDEQATILDIAPTILGLLGEETPEPFVGMSWAGALTGGETPGERLLCYQAHKGAVLGEHDDDRKRSKGLISVGYVEEDSKEILRVKNNTHMLFDLDSDPGELANLVEANGPPSNRLLECLVTISEGLGAMDRLKAKKLDDETIEQLKALGYIE